MPGMNPRPTGVAAGRGASGAWGGGSLPRGALGWRRLVQLSENRGPGVVLVAASGVA